MSHTLPKTDAESEKWRFPFRFRPIFSGKLVVLGMVMHPKHQDTWRHISPFWKFDQYSMFPGKRAPKDGPRIEI